MNFVLFDKMNAKYSAQAITELDNYEKAKFEVADKDQSESLAPIEMEAFVFPEHFEWTQEFAKMTKLDRLGIFQTTIWVHRTESSVSGSKDRVFWNSKRH